MWQGRTNSTAGSTVEGPILFPFDTSTEVLDPGRYSQGPIVAFFSDRQTLFEAVESQIVFLDGFADKYLGRSLGIPAEIISRRMEFAADESRNHLLSGLLADKAAPIIEIAEHLLNARDLLTGEDPPGKTPSLSKLIDEVGHHTIAAAALRFSAIPPPLRGSEPIEIFTHALGEQAQDSQWWGRHWRTLTAICDEQWKRFIREVAPSRHNPSPIPGGVKRAAENFWHFDQHRARTNRRFAIAGIRDHRSSIKQLVDNPRLTGVIDQVVAKKRAFAARSARPSEDAFKTDIKAAHDLLLKRLQDAAANDNIQEIYQTERAMRGLSYVQIVALEDAPSRFSIATFGRSLRKKR